MSFKKKPHIDSIARQLPDDSVAYFEDIKLKTEQYWAVTDINPKVYGFQIQRGTKWLSGLQAAELADFERRLGFTFPEALRNYYRTMNGTDTLAINVYGSQGEPPAYRPRLYSYPRDLAEIEALIEWIYAENQLTMAEAQQQGISRIMPMYSHRFMLIDIPGNPILSMYGRDIIYYADNLSKLLANQLLHTITHGSEFESDPRNAPVIKFWID